MKKKKFSLHVPDPGLVSCFIVGLFAMKGVQN